MNITIKRANENDANELIKIRNECFYDDFIKFGECPGYNMSYENMINNIKNVLLYTIIVDNKIIGDISVHPIQKDMYWIGCIAISPQYQNRGIGSYVIKYIEQNHSEVTRWKLETPISNIRNCYFYEKQGFVKVGEKVHSDKLTLCIFEKKMI